MRLRASRHELAFLERVLVILANGRNAAIERVLLHFKQHHRDAGVQEVHRDAGARCPHR